MTADDLLLIAALLGAALVGGILFAFSTFIMRGLARVPAPQGIAVMQAINVTVIRPSVFTVLFGTFPAGVAATLLMPGPWTGPRVLLTAAATVLYLAGCILITGLRNVPWNDRLAAVDAETEAAAELWSVYQRTWTRWNHLRVAACIGAALLFAAALRIGS